MKIKKLNFKQDKYGYIEANTPFGSYIFSKGKLNFSIGDSYDRLELDGFDYKEVAQKHFEEMVLEHMKEFFE